MVVLRVMYVICYLCVVVPSMLYAILHLPVHVGHIRRVGQLTQEEGQRIYFYLFLFIFFYYFSFLFILFYFILFSFFTPVFFF